MFSAKHLEIGQTGENLAIEWLKDRGFEIITRNYQAEWSEIDIIAKSKQGILSFIEVKTLNAGNEEMRQSEKGGNLKPEDNLTKAKLQRLKKACQYFANRNPKLVDDNLGWEIDLIAIHLSTTEISSLTKEEKSSLVKFYRNISFSI